MVQHYCLAKAVYILARIRIAYCPSGSQCPHFLVRHFVFTGMKALGPTALVWLEINCTWNKNKC